MSKDTDKHLKSIAKSLEQVVHLLKGDRPGVLKEPARQEPEPYKIYYGEKGNSTQLHIDKESVYSIADAVSEGVIQEEKEQE